MNNTKIIIIDDDESILSALKSLLDQYSVIGFTDAMAGIEAIKKNKFDFLILDYFLINTNGAEVVNKIREFDNDLYIFLLTGYKDDVPALAALEDLDIQFYCEKSADIENILITIESTLKSIKFLEKRNSKTCNFAYRLKELRKSRNVGQDELAKYVGVGRTAVGNWEAGLAEPSAEGLRKIAKFFGVSIDYLMCYEVDYLKK